MALSERIKKILNVGPTQTAKLGDVIDAFHPTHRLIAAGNFATVGGDATESITVTGALSTDLAVVVLKTAGAVPRTITTAAAASNAITVVLSGDPDDDHVLTYFLYRAVA